MLNIANDLKQYDLFALREIMKIQDATNRITALENNYEVTALREIKKLQTKIDKYEQLYVLWNELTLLVNYSIEENDFTLEKEIREAYAELVKLYKIYELEALFSGKYDENNAIITIHAGAGGTEAQDWADMLYRMYAGWAEKNNYKLEILNYLAGEVAGTKSVTFQLSGDNAYGWLKNENGVHRLIRISPFDAAKRRHTSFVSVDVMPEVENDTSIIINPEDIQMDTFRSSGAGGQHVNKTESAVRLTHLPTGIVVACQTERSQHQNRATAMKILKGKLVELMEQEHKENIAELKGIKTEIAWGNQIRTYTLHPYSLIKDHRSNFETGGTEKFLAGDIGECLQSLLV